MDDDEEFEFEGDSDEEYFRKCDAEASSKYRAVVHEWTLQHPGAEARFISEDLDESYVIVQLCGIQLQIYFPEDADSAFFVTTESTDATVNCAVTELNGTENMKDVFDVLTRASKLLGNDMEVETSNLSPPNLARCNSAAQLDFGTLRKLQETMITQVSDSAGVDMPIAALLLRHAHWNDDLLYQRLASDRDALLVAAGAALDAEREKLKSKGPQLCSVCFVDPAIECLPCGHGLCSDDWPGFLKCNLDSGTVGGENCLQLKCPGERCPLVIPSSLFELFLDQADYERYLRLRVLSFVNDNKDIVWCPADGCDRAVGFSQRRSTVKCGCGHIFCFSCQLPAHAPAKCSSAKAWAAKNEKISGVSKCSSASGDAKSCPNPACGVLSKKESGCHYLHCPRCKENWCWQCGDWGGGPSGRPEPHHVFDCNNPINQDWANSTVSAISDEGKYWFYHERYQNHLESLAFAERLRASMPAAASGGKVSAFVLSNPPEISRSYSSVLNNDMPGEGSCRSMLDSEEAWSAADDNVGQWMQIYLGSEEVIAGVIVQGCAGDKEEWVTWYRVEHSNSHVRPDGVVGEFRGSFDGSSKVQALFPTPVSAKYLRISPLSSHGHISMRVALLLLPKDGKENEISWYCPSCTFGNSLHADVCLMCDTPQPSETSDEREDVKRSEEAQQQLRDAADLLVECRRVLAWTYVWAFYQEDETQRRLFEFVQKDLETKTEDLSDITEKRTTAEVMKERVLLLDYVAALKGYLDHVREYTLIDPDLPKDMEE